jgi:hypothetical protein
VKVLTVKVGGVDHVLTTPNLYALDLMTRHGLDPNMVVGNAIQPKGEGEVQVLLYLDMAQTTRAAAAMLTAADKATDDAHYWTPDEVGETVLPPEVIPLQQAMSTLLIDAYAEMEGWTLESDAPEGRDRPTSATPTSGPSSPSPRRGRSKPKASG